MKIGIRQVLVVVVISAMVVLNLFSTTGTSAQPIYIRIVTVDGITVRISQDTGAEPQDVDRVHDAFVAAVNGSTLMKNRVIKAGGSIMYIRVSEDNPTVTLGRANDFSNFIWIDVGDSDAMLPFLEGFEGNNASIIVDGGITWTLAHEMGHLLGVDDPQTDENPVLTALGTGFQRKGYGYCREDGTEAVPLNVGSDFGELNSTAFQLERQRVGGLIAPIGTFCLPPPPTPPPPSVGGITELPEVSEFPLETKESPGTNYTPYITGAAAVIVALVIFTTGAWYAMRRKQ